MVNAHVAICHSGCAPKMFDCSKWLMAILFSGSWSPSACTSASQISAHARAQTRGTPPARPVKPAERPVGTQGECCGKLFTEFAMASFQRRVSSTIASDALLSAVTIFLADL